MTDRGHVQPDDIDDYNAILRAAHSVFAVINVPHMLLATDRIDPLSDLSRKLAVPEDVFRAYIGVDDDESELNVATGPPVPPCQE